MSRSCAIRELKSILNSDSVEKGKRMNNVVKYKSVTKVSYMTVVSADNSTSHTIQQTFTS